jgi:hypothetical protein
MLCMDTLQFSKYRSNVIPILSLILRNESYKYASWLLQPTWCMVYGICAEVKAEQILRMAALYT